MHITSDKSNAVLEMTLRTDTELTFRDGSNAVSISNTTPDKKSFSISHMQIRRNGDVVSCTATTTRKQFHLHLEISGTAGIPCNFHTRKTNQHFEIENGITEANISFEPDRGLSLMYAEPVQAAVVECVSDMDDETDPMLAFLQGDDTPAVTSPSPAANGEAAELHATITAQAEEKMKLQRQLTEMRRQAAENDKHLQSMRDELEAVMEMRESKDKEAHIQLLMKQLSLDEGLLASYRETPSGDTSEKELCDRAAVLSAAIHETVRLLIDIRQKALDTETAPSVG